MKRFLVSVSTVSARNAWHNDPRSVTQKRQRSQRATFRKIGWGCAARFLKPLFQTKISYFPYPISDLIKNLIPYLRPEALEPGAWPERVTSCYGTYTAVGVNIRREIVVSPNDEEPANSSKKHIKFKSRVHKPHPISDQNHTLWRRTYPYSLYKGLPPQGPKTRCRLWVSMLTQASLKNSLASKSYFA